MDSPSSTPWPLSSLTLVTSAPDSQRPLCFLTRSVRPWRTIPQPIFFRRTAPLSGHSIQCRRHRLIKLAHSLRHARTNPFYDTNSSAHRTVCRISLAPRTLAINNMYMASFPILRPMLIYRTCSQFASGRPIHPLHYSTRSPIPRCRCATESTPADRPAPTSPSYISSRPRRLEGYNGLRQRMTPSNHFTMQSRPTIQPPLPSRDYQYRSMERVQDPHRTSLSNSSATYRRPSTSPPSLTLILRGPSYDLRLAAMGDHFVL